MISYTSTSLFIGLFPIPSYKVKQAIKKHQDMRCIYGKQEMIIKELDLKNPVKESLMFDDKYNVNNGNQYNLYYYNWNPKSKNELDRLICGY